MTDRADYELTTGSAARALNRSEATIRTYHKNGTLTAVRTSNGHRLFSRTQVEALARAREAAQPNLEGERG